MLALIPLYMGSPILLAVAVLLALVAGASAARRNAAVPRASRVLAGAAMLLWCLAAGELAWQYTKPGRVAVLVDLSPSTRGARYRDPGQLNARLASLLGGAAHRLIYFAGDNQEATAAGNALADMRADHTVLAPPPDASAVVLFSDCRFALPPAAPPTYIVVDPGLDDPPDASVQDLSVGAGRVVATLADTSGARELWLIGASEPTTRPVAGPAILSAPLRPGARRASAVLSRGDRWPENDALSIDLPPARIQRWWVGQRVAPKGYESISAADLPVDSLEYLTPGVIVLDNVAVAQLSSPVRQRLEQYVRDLGGSLLLLGGDHAFAAGGYPGTTLERMSPLASSPPRPTVHWILLTDSSGSMAQAADGVTRWQVATSAIVNLLAQLPPADLVSIGGFAQDVDWWSTAAEPAREMATMALPPARVAPRGPTNLESALAQAARSAGSIGSNGDSVNGRAPMPTELLILTDAQSTIDKPDDLIAAFHAADVHLHVLAIGHGPALPALGRIADATGGTVSEQLDPNLWVGAAERLLRAAAPAHVQQTERTLRFSGELAGWPAQTISQWNRTWAKADADVVAEGRGQTEAGDQPFVPLVAKWSFGAGTVLATACPTPGLLAARLADWIARPPHDSRLAVRWDMGSELAVTVDALENGRFLNGLSLWLHLVGSDLEARGEPARIRIPQVAPGRYQLAIDAPHQPAIALVYEDGRIVDRMPIAGRYAREFVAVGNDYAAMRELAQRSGGAVVAPDNQSRLKLPGTHQRQSLVMYLCAGGAILLCLALIAWRRGAESAG